MNIKIDRKTTLDLEQFLYVWFNALPENHPRIRIEVGQREILFPIVVPLVTNEIGLFNHPSEGHCDRITVTSHPSPVRVFPGDLIHYYLNWDGF